MSTAGNLIECPFYLQSNRYINHYCHYERSTMSLFWFFFLSLYLSTECSHVRFISMCYFTFVNELFCFEILRLSWFALNIHPGLLYMNNALPHPSITTSSLFVCYYVFLENAMIRFWPELCSDSECKRSTSYWKYWICSPRPKSICFCVVILWSSTSLQQLYW